MALQPNVHPRGNLRATHEDPTCLTAAPSDGRLRSQSLDNSLGNSRGPAEQAAGVCAGGRPRSTLAASVAGAHPLVAPRRLQPSGAAPRASAADARRASARRQHAAAADLRQPPARRRSFAASKDAGVEASHGNAERCNDGAPQRQLKTIERTCVLGPHACAQFVFGRGLDLRQSRALETRLGLEGRH